MSESLGVCTTYTHYQIPLSGFQGLCLSSLRYIRDVVALAGLTVEDYKLRNPRNLTFSKCNQILGNVSRCDTNYFYM